MKHNLPHKIFWKPVFISLGTSLLCGACLFVIGNLFLSSLFNTYGWTLFIGFPILSGALTVHLASRKSICTLKKAVALSIATGFLACGIFMALGIEGIVCVLMALPVVIPMCLTGGVLYFIFRKLYSIKNQRNTTLFLLLCAPLLIGSGAVIEKNYVYPLREVRTEVIITGDINQVWQEVIAFSPIPKSDDFIFKLGIAQPLQARIEGEGVGAVRYCQFTTGDFVEPITAWETNQRLAFDVSKQPQPLTEVTPMLKPMMPRLDWAVQSERGEFVLEDLGNGQIRLTGTTWYRMHLSPEIYWGNLGDKFIHKIHLRVLEHIKHTVEHHIVVAQESETQGEIPNPFCLGYPYGTFNSPAPRPK